MAEENEKLLEMHFDPRTVKHLGVRMYATLPPALAELISNAYDADAEKVTIRIFEDGDSKAIEVEDDGYGLSFDEINRKFLIIGRDRREEEGDTPSPRFGRKPTGKKGLGKLALFGLAEQVTITTCKDGFLNEFVLDWQRLTQARGVYKPEIIRVQEATNKPNGTRIHLSRLKRKTAINPEALADSLSRMFIFDETFQVFLETANRETLRIDNERSFKSLNIEFRWELNSQVLIPQTSEYFGKIQGFLLTSVKPIPPSFGMRGVTLFSRGKLVNAPEFFTQSDSSHFYQYLTGWMSVDFIDELPEDVISTNRQSLDWEHPEMKRLREFISGIISQVNADWRRKRKAKKEENLKEKTGIDHGAWTATMPDDIRENTQRIIESLGGEDALENYTPVIKALHAIVPEYPLYHWRHLHAEIRDAAEVDYKRQDFYRAFLEAAKRFINNTRTKSNSSEPSESTMMGAVYGHEKCLKVTNGYKRLDGQDFNLTTIRAIEDGQKFLSMGIVSGGRNPVSHEEVCQLRESGLFSEKDCLDGLSLLSHLQRRLDSAEAAETDTRGVD